MTWKCTGSWMGCERQFTEEDFASWDLLTQRECDISGLCDRCQDVVFAEPAEDCNPGIDWYGTA